MIAIDRRSALMGILRGAAIVAAGVAVLPSAAEAMEIARVRSTEDPGLFRKSSNRCRRASAPTPTPLGLLAAQGTSRLRLALGLTRVLEAAASPRGSALRCARRSPAAHLPRASMRRTREEVSPMTEAPSKTKILLAQLVVALMIAFVALGLAWYGFSAEVRERIWRNLLDRPGGPMTFRFILQPIMATIAALYDGVEDARTGRSPYLWTILCDPDGARRPPARGTDLHRSGHSLGSVHGRRSIRSSSSMLFIRPRRSSSRSCSRSSPTCCCAALAPVSRAWGSARGSASGHPVVPRPRLHALVRSI